MKKNLYKLIMLCTLMILSTIVTGFSDIGIPYRYDHRLDANYKSIILPNLTLLYDNVWATVYNPEKNQCDETPFLTGDGSIINNETINNLRWIAISQEMLNCANRQKLLTYSRTNLYKGKINYGDTIWISSKFPEIINFETLPFSSVVLDILLSVRFGVVVAITTVLYPYLSNPGNVPVP